MLMICNYITSKDSLIEIMHVRWKLTSYYIAIASYVTICTCMLKDTLCRKYWSFACGFHHASLAIKLVTKYILLHYIKIKNLKNYYFLMFLYYVRITKVTCYCMIQIYFYHFSELLLGVCICMYYKTLHSFVVII